MAKRLFYDYAAPVAVLFGHETNFGDAFDDVTEEIWSGGEVKDIVAVGILSTVDLGKLVFQIVVGCKVVKISAEIKNAADKGVPYFRVDGASGELLEIFRELFAGVFIAHGRAANADHGELFREQLLAGEVVKSWNQLAAREIAGIT